MREWAGRACSQERTRGADGGGGVILQVGLDSHGRKLTLVDEAAPLTAAAAAAPVAKGSVLGSAVGLLRSATAGAAKVAGGGGGGSSSNSSSNGGGGGGGPVPGTGEGVVAAILGAAPESGPEALQDLVEMADFYSNLVLDDEDNEQCDVRAFFFWRDFFWREGVRCVCGAVPSQKLLARHMGV